MWRRGRVSLTKPGKSKATEDANGREDESCGNDPSAAGFTLFDDDSDDAENERESETGEADGPGECLTAGLSV
jgi:hypothetical protein